MRTKTVLLLVLSLSAAACHSRGGYFTSDPVLALGPGCPDCPSRSRWPAYFGTGGGATPQAEEIQPVALAPAPRPEPVRPAPINATVRTQAPARPTMTVSVPAATSTKRSSTVEAPRLDADFGIGRPQGEVVFRPAPRPSNSDEPVAPPRPGAPLPPPASPRPYSWGDNPNTGGTPNR
jgi:hypothetical protein